MSRSLVLVTIIFFGSISPAHAYLDPGTGSIILQAVAGALIGISLFWNALVFKVKSFFQPNKDSNIKED